MKGTEFTELGTLLISIMMVVLCLIQWSYFSQSGSNPLTFAPYLFLTGLFLLITLLFYKLTVSVSSNDITLSYGIGFIKITKQIDEIISIEELITPWYWGLGIRMTPKGWLYNIQSRKALEVIYLKDQKEKKFLVGSDKREKLKAELLATKLS